MNRLTKTLGALALAGAVATPAAASDKKPEHRTLDWSVGAYLSQDDRTTGVDNWFAGAKGAVANLGMQISGDGSQKYGSLHLEAQLYRSHRSLSEHILSQNPGMTRAGRKLIGDINFYSSHDWVEVTDMEDGLKIGPRFGLLYRTPPTRGGVSGEIGIVAGRASFGERRLTTRYVEWDGPCGDCYGPGTIIVNDKITGFVQEYDKWAARPPKWSGIEKTVFVGFRATKYGPFGLSFRLSKSFGTDPRFSQYDNLLDVSAAVTYGSK